MSLQSFAEAHIGKRGEVKNAGWEEDARVTKFSRFGNWNIRKLEGDMDAKAI